MVLSNVLLVNNWIHEIGRYAGANYEILKLALELNLQFFNKETPKQLIFVIRDYNENENFSFIQETLVGDV